MERPSFSKYYHAKWYRNNHEKAQQYQLSYWLRQAIKLGYTVYDPDGNKLTIESLTKRKGHHNATNL